MKKKLWGLLAFVVLAATDQLTKLWAGRLQGQAPLVLIPGVFQLQYHQNTGMAFGMLQNGTWLLAVLSAVLVGVLLWVYLRLPQTGSYRVYRVLLLVLAAGGAGNGIDRILRGYVVDFLHFSLINFPIFNLADCYVTVGAIVLAIYVLATRDDRLEVVFGKKPPLEQNTDDKEGQA